MKMRYTVLLAIIATGSLWLQSCQDKPAEVQKDDQVENVTDDATYMKLGKEIVGDIGPLLKDSLVGSMKKGGPLEAIKFCNVQATELTKSFAEEHNADTKRVSDKNRNPENAASPAELEVMAHYRQLMEAGEPLLPKVVLNEQGRKNFYAPILTANECLACHGAASEMQPELVQLIDSLYPTDKAKGYAVKELRGLWSVNFRDN